jgi:hypothetical protein
MLANILGWVVLLAFGSNLSRRLGIPGALTNRTASGNLTRVVPVE